MEHDGGGDLFGDTRVSMILLGVGSAAFVVAFYHCVSVGWCNRHVPRPSPSEPRTLTPQNVEMANRTENPTGQLIPAQKYQKGMGLVGDDGLCSVCLCEFEEGEELRTLPECLHSFHAPCIDMWLYSHPNCPMCRADAVPSPQIFPPSELSPVGLEPDMLQIVVQSRTRALV
ncbi:hypothetical protein Pint_06270 [Pistacia integerrima]|uniref:Uncharacterized protein n=1 Tax=Pistacia integerrima TaxID=434235 RepID=A0ACC0Z2B5_9ROSI|nr:hypothetical protein Pint_06270 [Pistacia integerrima]